MRPVFRRPKALFLLGTMRSGSSLLTNILISNPDISGFGESHVIYDHPDRLLDLRYWVARYLRHYPGGGQYLFDKILHTDYTPDLPMILRASDARVLFQVRDPAATASSLRRMYEGMRSVDASRIDVWALLAARYRDLARLCGDIPADTPVAALSYDALVGDTAHALENLTAFLGLREPLSETYDVPRWVGTWGLGDGSAKIRSGRIEPQARPQAAKAIPAEVQDAYEMLLERLAACCDPALL